ncbi:Hypothetical predicted protein [Octopus vulgaris]|uniref:Uncharacterized protein n=1 Tax=Octopus vulgaris TaxID=6645 RepID=A0AA36BG31_OCTVU|nr:Hypothetical predicted protein [Octopus vulgaris]
MEETSNRSLVILYINNRAAFMESDGCDTLSTTLRLIVSCNELKGVKDKSFGFVPEVYKAVSHDCYKNQRELCQM